MPQWFTISESNLAAVVQAIESRDLSAVGRHPGSNVEASHPVNGDTTARFGDTAVKLATDVVVCKSLWMTSICTKFVFHVIGGIIPL